MQHLTPQPEWEAEANLFAQEAEAHYEKEYWNELDTLDSIENE